MKRLWILISGALTLLSATLMTSAAPQIGTGPADPEPSDQTRLVRPEWHVGDKWAVETVTRPIQTSDLKQAAVIRWEFTVAGREEIEQAAAFRIDIRCFDVPARQSAASLWVDATTGSLRQVKMQIPVAGAFRSLTERYTSPGGTPSPVLGPLTALPVDLPVFLRSNAKGAGDFEYQASSGPPGAKAVGEIGFTFSVQQKIAVSKQERAKRLTPKSLARSLGDEAGVEVEIRRFDRSVRQLWRGSLPWPVYSTNGRTESRLIQVTRKNR